MNKFVLSLFAASTAISAAPAIAAPIFAPVPTANYITFGGRDWAWAAPCRAVQLSCGVVDMTFQSGQGWSVAQAGDFATGPTASDFGTVGTFKCASAWFSTQHLHCDYGDASSFHIYNHPGNGGNDVASLETWVVRGAAGGVPEPSAWALLILGFGVAGASMRRKVSAQLLAA